MRCVRSVGARAGAVLAKGASPQRYGICAANWACPRTLVGRIVPTLLSIAFIASAVSLPVSAQDTTWTGTADSSFPDNGNWDNSAPNAATNALITNATANQPTLATAGAANNLTVNNNTLTITVPGVLVVSGTGTIQANGIISNAGTLSTALGLTIESGGKLDTNTATSIINGGIDNTGTVNAANQVNGAIVNHGLGAIFTVTGLLAGNDSFTNSNAAKLDVSGGDFTGITTLNNSSTITIGGGHTLSAGVINNTGGSIDVGANSKLEGISNTLTNAATINVATNGAVTDAGAITNQATGKINFNGPGGLATLSSGTNTITNEGQINVISGGVDITDNISNQVNGLINLAAGAGTVGLSGNLTNKDTAQVTVDGGTLNILTGTLANSSTALMGVRIAAGTVVNANDVSNASGSTIANAGTLSSTNPISNAGKLDTNTATSIINGGIDNTGTVNAANQVNGAIVNHGLGAIFTVTGTLAGNDSFTNSNAAKLDVSGGDFTGITTLNNSSTITISGGHTLSAGVINNTGGSIDVGANSKLEGISNTLTNAATINVATNGAVTDAGAITNQATGKINFNGPGGLATLSSGTNTITNEGQINVISGGVDLTGNISNQVNGLINLAAGAGTVGLSGNLTNKDTAQVTVDGGTLHILTGTLANSSTALMGVRIAAGTVVNANDVSNASGSTIANAGTLSSTNPISNAGKLDTNTATSIINGGIDNTGTVNAANQVNGAIVNHGLGAIFTVTGTLAGNDSFTNSNAATLDVSGGNFTGITTLNNSSTITISGGRMLAAADVSNASGATIANA